ncbi:hypothetical protein VTO42DRAFT_5527 [Malbranchea cinnamomea]
MANCQDRPQRTHRSKEGNWFFSFSLILATFLPLLHLVTASPLDLLPKRIASPENDAFNISRRAVPAIRSSPAAVKGIVKRAAETWEGRVEKGRLIKCLLEAQNEEEARRINGGFPVARSWTYDDLKSQGWSYDIGKASNHDDALKKLFEELGVNTDNFVLVASVHDGQNVFEGSMGYYINEINTADGVIIADQNLSPELSGAGGDIPELKQWSDVAFIQWQRQAGGNIRGLRAIIRLKVMNPDTQDRVIDAIRRRGGDRIPAYANRITFGMDTEEGLAILGSKNGAGCGYLLAQHKEGLGVKTIRDVTVWAFQEWGFHQDRENLSLIMYFRVEDV